MTIDVILPIVGFTSFLLVLVWALRPRISALIPQRQKNSQWKKPFDGVTPLQPVTSRDARQAYQELKSYDKLAPSLIEAAKQEALNELQQIVEDHHKTKKKG